MTGEQNIWGQGQRRDGNSEWPSTNFSTMSGALDETPRLPRRRKTRAGFAGLVFTFSLILILSAVGVMSLGRHLHG
jgi:hypothetical protein